jgi:galactokinase
MRYNILEQYQSRFNHPQIYVKSPGRANIIGEHTDYNHGLVLPFAIKQCIHMYLGKNDKGRLRIFAYDLNESAEIDLTQLEYQNSGWTRYFVNAMVACGYDKSMGMDIVFGGNLPQGGGVSSSSALTCGFLAGLNNLFNLKNDTDRLINLASQAENGIGLNGGIMDQTAIFKGKKDKALKIDFLDFSLTEYQLPTQDFSFYLFNSGQKHNLVQTEYNQRRAECEKALKQIQAKKPNIDTFRDLTKQDVYTHLKNNTLQKRSLHVVEENERVEMAISALQAKNYEKLGHLILMSHKSLSQNYEVSTPQIDYLVERSQSISNILGSRLMGGGFGGCTINFVKGKLSDEAINELKSDYTNQTGLFLEIIEICASEGIQTSYLLPSSLDSGGCMK